MLRNNWATSVLDKPFAGLCLCLIVSGALVVVMSAHPAFASKKIGPPPLEEVASTWVGLSKNELYLFRLFLTLDGKGSVGYVFLDQEPRILALSSWQYSRGRIEIEAEFKPGAEKWDGPMIGSVNHREMTLRISGKGWSRSISLRREAELERRWLALKSDMETLQER